MRRDGSLSFWGFVIGVVFFLAVFLLFTLSINKKIEIKKGETVTFIEFQDHSSSALVAVKNTQPIGRFDFGSFCSVYIDGVVTVIGVDGGRVLVRYSPPPEFTSLGSGSCPTGVVFFLDADRFVNYKKAHDSKEAEKNLVKKLLGE